MLSSNALVHNSKKTLHMLQKSPIEDPYSVQIAGASVDIVKGAVEVLNDQEGIDIIDLNCGCPVPKVVGHGSGSSLLLNEVESEAEKDPMQIYKEKAANISYTT